MTETAEAAAMADEWSDDKRSVDQIESEEMLSSLYGTKPETTADEPPETPAQQKTPAETPSDDDEPDRPDSYTAEEWAFLTKAEAEVQQLRADERKLAAVKAALQKQGNDIVKACGGDREKAAAFRTDLKALEESVAQRRKGEAMLRQRIGEHTKGRRQASAFRQMTKAEPALADAGNRRALYNWLRDQGHKAEDIEHISPHQAAVMWRTMQSKAPERKPTIPNSARRPMRHKSQVKTVRTDGSHYVESPGSKLAREFYGSPPRKLESTTELLMRHGKRDDAVSILYG